MKRKSLFETNPYTQDPKKRAKLIHRSVETSSAVEGIYVSVAEAKKTKAARNKE